MQDTKMVKFTFRNGKVLVIDAESVVSNKDEKSVDNRLFIDGEPVANIGRGLPNFDANNNWVLYNCSPLRQLYEMMPEDWDRNDSQFRVIDEVFVSTKTLGNNTNVN